MQKNNDVNSGSGGTDKVRCHKYDRMGEKRTIITNRHNLGLDRFVSALSNISSKVCQFVFIHLLYNSAQRYNCSIIPCGNATEHACPEAERWQHHHWTW
jgi:hypothetical protein